MKFSDASSVSERVCPVLSNTGFLKETVTASLRARDIYRRHTAIYRAHGKYVRSKHLRFCHTAAGRDTDKRFLWCKSAPRTFGST